MNIHGDREVCFCPLPLFHHTPPELTFDRILLIIVLIKTTTDGIEKYMLPVVLMQSTTDDMDGKQN